MLTKGLAVLGVVSATVLGTLWAAQTPHEKPQIAGPVRVIYRWRVPPEKQAEFVAAWEAATAAITELTSDALGSELFRNPDRPEELTAIARWRSLAAWQGFRSSPRAPIPGVEAMLRSGSLISTEPLLEVRMLLRPGPEAPPQRLPTPPWGLSPEDRVSPGL